MPDSDDLPQQEAIDIAAQTASSKFGITLETLLDQFTMTVSFFDADYRQYTGHYWWIVFDELSGIESRGIELFISSPAGEVVDFFK